MAKTELLEESGTAGTSTGPVDVLIGVAGSVDPLDMPEVLTYAAAAFAGPLPNGRIAFAHVDNGGVHDKTDAELEGQSRVKILSYKPGPGSTGNASWLTSPATYSSLFALARTTAARATVVISSDMAALVNSSVATLAAPILAGDCELAMPIYVQSRFAGLLNAGILSPLTRALYGKRVRYPLAQDFAIAPSLVSLFEQPAKRAQHGGETIFWPATQAASNERKLCQVYVDVNHSSLTEGVELSTVLAQVLSPLFSDMELNASIWQRVRGSHAVPTGDQQLTPARDHGRIETRSMVESFSLASRNLQDVWSLILPPVTLLELKRLTRSTPEQFHMPDALWVRIIYDFALAHRLRTLSRSHLMGALIPLYLAWIASYVSEVVSVSDSEADDRLEQLAIAYETGKPYLVSRWRWPDRFNP